MGFHTSKAVWRRLLQLDRPVIWRSEAELDAEVERNFRWNFAVNFLDGAFFWLGLSFISHTTILPLFVSKLTTAPLIIALLAILGQSSWYLPQLLTAGLIEKMARKKPAVVNLGLFLERLPLGFLPLAALLSERSPTLALTLFFIVYAIFGFGAGAVAPAWSDLVARCFPVHRRGRFFGITSFAGAGLGTVGAFFSAWLLDTYPFPTNFVYAFTIAASTIVLSWVFIALTREPVQPVAEEILRERGASLNRFKRILAGDRNFRNYLLTRLLTSLGNMGAGFLTVAALQRWQVADSSVGVYTAALLLGQTTGHLLAGFVADRHGHKLSLEVGLCAFVAAYLLAWWAPTALWFNLVFFLVGSGVGIVIVSGLLINMEFSRPERRPTYIGMANTTVGLGNVLAPSTGGLLALVGYSWLFAASALFGLAALATLHLAVREPRGQTEFFDTQLIPQPGKGNTSA
jgi:MFS family permease